MLAILEIIYVRDMECTTTTSKTQSDQNDRATHCHQDHDGSKALELYIVDVGIDDPNKRKKNGRQSHLATLNHGTAWSQGAGWTMCQGDVHYMDVNTPLMSHNSS